MLLSLVGLGDFLCLFCIAFGEDVASGSSKELSGDVMDAFSGKPDRTSKLLLDCRLDSVG